MESPDTTTAGLSAAGSVAPSSTALHRRLGRWPIHPIILAVFPILALFAQNAGQVRISDPMRLVACAVLGAALLWLALGVMLRDTRKAALAASAAILLFFTFDHVFGWVENFITTINRYWVPRRAVVAPGIVLAVEAILLVGLVYFLWKKKRDFRVATAFVNVFSVVVVAMPLYESVLVKVPVATRKSRVAEPFVIPPQSAPAVLPDIYYIILDGYARTDVMKSLFDFDNSSFLTHLEDLGFYVARESTANYCQTPLSLSASLNSVYLDDLVKGLKHDQTELSGFIGKSSVVETLKPLGYKFVTFATGFDPTEFPEADIYLSPQRYWNAFERMVIDCTWLRVIWPNPAHLDRTMQSRQRTFYLLDQLPQIPRLREPTFTLAHVFCPHPPFVFGENGDDVSAMYSKYLPYSGEKIRGRFRDPASFCAGYRDQSAFITRRIREAIDRLLAASDVPPIIILQSDHGSELNLDPHSVQNTNLKERMGILNAYYFPGRQYGALYQQVTPVNSFRIVLNTIFGARLKLLEDRSFFSTWKKPYVFHDVTDAVRAREN